MKSVLTTCPFCSCGCGFYLQVREGRLIGVAPSEHHPVAQGRLCARGWSAHEAPSWGERITRPLIRRGDSLVPASWNEALDEAARRLKEARSASKGIGVLGSARATNEENFLAAKLARAALGTSQVDSCLRSSWQPFVKGAAAAGNGSMPAGTLKDVERSEVVIVVEGDLARSQPIAAHAVMRAVKSGAKLVTIGTAQTRLARIATMHIPAAPGAREATLAALANRGAGMNEMLRKVAHWYVEARTASILYAPDNAPADRVEREARSLARLASLAEHLGRPGSAFLLMATRSNLRGACEMGVGPENGEATAVERIGGTPRLLGHVAALLVVADDPPATLADPLGAREALGRLESLIVLDAFMTPTAKMAHVVLPIASFAENEGTVTTFEGRVQRVAAAMPPPGEARAGWQVLAELGGRLGLQGSYSAAADVLAEIENAVPAYHGVSDRMAREEWGTTVAAAPVGAIAATALAAAGAGGAGRSAGAAGMAGAGSAGGAGFASPDPVDAPGAADHSGILALEGAFDWGRDPMVAGSPTLSRDYTSRKKIYPRGLMRMNKADAEEIGVRQGWTVKVSSQYGQALLPVVLSAELERGSFLVPWGFREEVAAVLGGQPETPVKVEKTA